MTLSAKFTGTVPSSPDRGRRTGVAVSRPARRCGTRAPAQVPGPVDGHPRGGP